MSSLLTWCFFCTDTVRDFSPVDKRHVYDPWGKSGAGAPIKGLEGQIQTRTAGRVAQDSSVSIIILIFYTLMFITFNLIVLNFLSDISEALQAK